MTELPTTGTASHGGTWVQRHIRTSAKPHNRIKSEDKMLFFQQLTTLFSAGTPLLEALGIVAGFALVGLLVDRLLTGFIRRLAARSETTFDDRLVEVMHRPILTTVGLVGLILATYRLDLSLTLERNTVLMVRTILVLVWVVFGFRFLRLLLGTMGRRSDRFGIVQQSTEPVLSNVAAVLLQSVTSIDARSQTLHFADDAVPFDLLVGVPPHRAPQLVTEAGLVDGSGYVPVHPQTLEILADEKAMKSLRKSIKQAKEDKWIDIDEVFH